MCLGQWSLLGYVHDSNVQEVALLPEVPEEEGDEDGNVMMLEDFDKIV